MTIIRCQWCNSTATGTVTAKGLGSPIPYCDSRKCWDSTYRKLGDLLPRTWKMIDPAEQQPDLLDLLTESEGSA